MEYAYRSLTLTYLGVVREVGYEVAGANPWILHSRGKCVAAQPSRHDVERLLHIAIVYI
jgi:hypothetical protein